MPWRAHACGRTCGVCPGERMHAAAHAPYLPNARLVLCEFSSNTCVQIALHMIAHATHAAERAEHIPDAALML
eukprot:365486-Chlamydomonas_euryale.AAC.5